MSWFEDANCEAESLKEHNLIAIAVDAEFPSGNVRVTTWLPGLTLDSNPYLSVAGIASASRTADHTRLVSETRVYALSGVDPSVIPESEIDASFGGDWTEYWVWLHPQTHAVIGREVDFSGRIGRIRRVRGPTPMVQVFVDHRLVILEDPDALKRTDEHHQRIWSGDTAYRHAARLESEEFAWGGTLARPGTEGPGNRGLPSRGRR